jgi:hypothetical protein
VEKELSALTGASRVLHQPANGVEEGFVVESSAELDLREAVFELAVRRHWPVLALQQKSLSLEEVFQALTRQEVR